MKPNRRAAGAAAVAFAAALTGCAVDDSPVVQRPSASTTPTAVSTPGAPTVPGVPGNSPTGPVAFDAARLCDIALNAAPADWGLRFVNPQPYPSTPEAATASCALDAARNGGTGSSVIVTWRTAADPQDADSDFGDECRKVAVIGSNLEETDALCQVSDARQPLAWTYLAYRVDLTGTLTVRLDHRKRAPRATVTGEALDYARTIASNVVTETPDVMS